MPICNGKYEILIGMYTITSLYIYILTYLHEKYMHREAYRYTKYKLTKNTYLILTVP